MKILIVEDEKLQIEAAKRQLAGHEITIVTNFTAACKALHIESSEPSPHEVLLTDFMYPKKGPPKKHTTRVGKRRLNHQLPYGPILVLHALQKKVPYIGLISNGDWTNDPLESALDGIKGFMTPESRFRSTTTSYLVVNRTTWKAALDSNEPQYSVSAFNRKFYCWVKNWQRLLQAIIDPKTPLTFALCNGHVRSGTLP